MNSIDEVHPYKKPTFRQITSAVTCFDGTDCVTLYALDEYGNVWRLLDSVSTETKVWQPLTTERARRPERDDTPPVPQKLIDAAPDLLAALEQLLEWSQSEYCSNPDIDARALAAIRKARQGP